MSNDNSGIPQEFIEDKHLFLIRSIILAVLVVGLIGYKNTLFSSSQSKKPKESVAGFASKSPKVFDLPFCVNAQNITVTEKEPQFVAVYNDCAQAEISWTSVQNSELKITKLGTEKYYVYDCGKLVGIYSSADLTRAPGNTLRIAGAEGIVRLRLAKTVP
ncbi:MAG: hypothetical protein A3I89_02820 [Candidatus Harrisonbacteria bacterium RIFCSPLOWO2_02_FULL_41_11]|uniref:Uncharacterized protein n=1 Tax=Candidatus Harrisonbacteria bacterium RIFCSPHIGHO2_02_FULL_42_16 TaxID=1798404 RepID=A0A1G1ZGH9_9BACT|nr:MAG: hypothetical protein A3B92_03275 [Candidatus Harrisonbacteria bacterium RIFCSPHIGHO2_02_FULL_42_16]OGY67319.1 MAG: hypothetical protein A3I89_02820 [Candidatus Harrisonbacteria bacterium RIFCSPLOWO2_02_FULL_41_11]